MAEIALAAKYSLVRMISLASFAAPLVSRIAV
jgi:hypothetical protein